MKSLELVTGDTKYALNTHISQAYLGIHANMSIYTYTHRHLAARSRCRVKLQLDRVIIKLTRTHEKSCM